MTKREISLMRCFVTFLGENLQKEHALKIKKKNLDSENPLFNIIQTHNSFAKMKEGILNILKDLTDKELNNLEELSKKVDKPIFFEDLFILARIYFANSISDGFTRISVLLNICEVLIKSGNFELAIGIPNSISDVAIKTNILLHILKILILEGNFERAIAN